MVAVKLQAERFKAVEKIPHQFDFNFCGMLYWNRNPSQVHVIIYYALRTCSNRNALYINQNNYLTNITWLNFPQLEWRRRGFQGDPLQLVEVSRSGAATVEDQKLHPESPELSTAVCGYYGRQSSARCTIVVQHTIRPCGRVKYNSSTADKRFVAALTRNW